MNIERQEILKIEKICKKVFREEQSSLLETLKGFEYFSLFIVMADYVYLDNTTVIQTSKRMSHHILFVKCKKETWYFT